MKFNTGNDSLCPPCTEVLNGKVIGDPDTIVWIQRFIQIKQEKSKM